MCCGATTHAVSMADHYTLRLATGVGERVGRRASLVGRGLDVWEVVATIDDNDGSLTEAAAYHGEHREEIDGQIAANEED